MAVVYPPPDTAVAFRTQLRLLRARSAPRWSDHNGSLWLVSWAKKGPALALEAFMAVDFEMKMIFFANIEWYHGDIVKCTLVDGWTSPSPKSKQGHLASSSQLLEVKTTSQLFFI